MVNIRQMLVSPSMYYCKCPYSMTPQGITVHNTANDASANNEVKYMIGNYNEVSYHYAVDDVEIIQALPLDRNAWHAGDGGSGFGNRNTIGIEICYSRSGGNRFDKAEENAADLIAYLLKKYGWGIDRVKRHYDYDLTGKYCPHRTMDKGWQRFLNMVVARLNGTTTNTTTNNQEENGVNRSMYIFSKNWYLKAYPDVAQSKTYKDDPYTHYEKYGKKEGRKPLPPIPAEFCEGDYLELNPDVAEAVKKGSYVSGIHHYLMYGFNEPNRKINKNETEENLKKRVEKLEKELKEEKERIKKIKDIVNE